jgi:hypothetical protein
MGPMNIPIVNDESRNFFYSEEYRRQQSVDEGRAAERQPSGQIARLPGCQLCSGER